MTPATALRDVFTRWSNPAWRMAFYRLLVLEFKLQRGIGVRMAIALVLTALPLRLLQGINSAADGYLVLQITIGALALFHAAFVLESEHRQGMLEVRILSMGGGGPFLRLKAMVQVLAVLLPAIPAAMLAAWFFAAPSLVLIVPLSVGIFVAAIVAGAFFLAAATRSPWAALIGVAAILAGAWVAPLPNLLDPWLNPYGMPESLATGGGAFRAQIPSGVMVVLNRAVLVGLTALLLRLATRRLPRLFRG